MNNLEQYIETLFSNKLASNIAIKIGKGNTTLYETYRSEKGTIDEFTLFDMASVTKILATTTLCLVAVDKGLLNLNTSVSEFFTNNSDKRNMTISHLLTHTIGSSPKRLNFPCNNYDNIADYILSICSFTDD